jgi:hypothetical protein
MNELRVESCAGRQSERLPSARLTAHAGAKTPSYEDDSTPAILLQPWSADPEVACGSRYPFACIDFASAFRTSMKRLARGER